jgi:hypothetical protein
MIRTHGLFPTQMDYSLTIRWRYGTNARKTYLETDRTRTITATSCCLLIIMKALLILAIAAAVVSLTPTASADKYSDLAAQDFRWSNAHGPYACVSQDDVRRMVNNPSDEVMLKMVEQVKAYFLTTGALVQVIEEDPHAGLSKVRLAGVTVELWTLTKFLSRHPIKDIYGVVETPETSGLIPTARTMVDTGPTPPGDFNLSPSPGASPLPGMSQLPRTGPTPAESPTPTPQMNQ